MGAWDFLKELLTEVAVAAGVKHPELRYAGRESSASPATGLMSDHLLEQACLIDEALSLKLAPSGRIAHREAVHTERQTKIKKKTQKTKAAKKRPAKKK